MGYSESMRSYLSYSQLALYLQCPLKYKLVYIDEIEREGMPAALAFGRAIHRALAQFYTDVMDKEPFDLDRFLATFADAWEEEAEGKEIIYKEGENFVSLLAQGKAMLQVFARSVRPLRVIAVEVPFEFRLEHPKTGKEFPIPIKGVIDLVEQDEQGTLWVVDHKTAGRAFSEAQVAGDLQLLIYAAAVMQLEVTEGRDVLLRLDVLLKGKRPRMLQYCTERTEQDIARLFEIVDGMWKAIDAEAFYPRCCISTWFGVPHEECVAERT